MRLIDADALKEKICTNVYPVQDAFNSCDYGMFWTGGIEKAIDAAPTIKPKKGKWKPFDLTWGRSVWACDACGETVDVPTLNGKPIFDYCPWCGARMDEVSDEHTD